MLSFALVLKNILKRITLMKMIIYRLIKKINYRNNKVLTISFINKVNGLLSERFKTMLNIKPVI